MLIYVSCETRVGVVGVCLKECVTSTRTKVFRINQKFIKVLKCSAKFKCRPVDKIRWYWV